MKIRDTPRTLSAWLNDVVNVSILCVLLLVGVRYLMGRTATSRIQYQPGEVLLQVPETAVSGSERTLFFQVRSTCQYCAGALPFYRQLVTRIRSAIPGLRLVGIAGEAGDVASSYLRRNSIELDFVITASPKDPRQGMTPALVMVDSRRRVIGSWIGVLSDEQQRDIETTIGLAPRDK